MRHAVPLTNFQEKLFDIVTEAYVKQTFDPQILNNTVAESQSIKAFDTAEDLELPLGNHDRHIHEYQDVDIRNPILEKAETYVEIIWGLISDNLYWIFPLFIICNVLWLQIELVWMSSENHVLIICITLLKWMLILLLCGYYCYIGYMRIKTYMGEHRNTSQDKSAI